MDHFGIDVHKKESQICILTEGGELIVAPHRRECDEDASVGAKLDAVLGERGAEEGAAELCEASAAGSVGAVSSAGSSWRRARSRLRRARTVARTCATSSSLGVGGG